jgi:hypothetical protein
MCFPVSKLDIFVDVICYVAPMRCIYFDTVLSFVFCFLRGKGAGEVLHLFWRHGVFCFFCFLRERERG